MGLPPIKKSKPTPEAAADADEVEPVNEEVEADTEGADLISFGEESEERIKTAAAEAMRPRAFDFFITKKEVQNGGGAFTAEVHVALDYADKDWYVAMPFCSIKEGDRFRLVPSPGDDCAIAAAGVTPSVRPVYFLIDHRTYKNKEGQIVGDSIKRWIPAPSIAGLMNNAVENLCENLDKDRDEIDLRDYKLKITKTGTGRGTAWSLDFVARKKPLSEDVTERVGKFFGQESGRLPTLSEYRDFMRKMFAPESKYMLSKGGVYHKPTKITEEKDGKLPF